MEKILKHFFGRNRLVMDFGNLIRRALVVLCFVVLGMLPLSLIAEPVSNHGFEGLRKMFSSPVTPRSEPSQSHTKEYIIGSEDVLNISVWQYPEISQTVRVRYDGKINVQPIGSVTASGLTTDELEKSIADKLRDFLREPQVTISVKEFNSQKVVVLGEGIGKPGDYSLKGPTPILEIVTHAGLNMATADLQSIRVIRKGEPPILVNLAELFAGDIRQNVLLKPKDTVYVPKLPPGEISPLVGETQVLQGETEIVHKILALGAFHKQGPLKFDEDEVLTVHTAIVKAGGLTNHADFANAKVVRSDGFEDPVDLNRLLFRGDLSQDLALNDGDRLIVPITKNITFYVLGFVAKQGVYSARPEHSNVLQAMALAGGGQFGAKTTATRVIRDWPNDPKVFSVNLPKLFDGDISQNLELKQGDVVYIPRTFGISVLMVIERLLSPLESTISLAGQIDALSKGQTSISVLR